MYKKYLHLFILLIVLHFPLQAQTYSPQQVELAERLHSLAKNAPPELAYIQTSKDIYETGEDLWFKVYLLDAQYLIPSRLSKTLYLQLLNESTKKEVWQEKYEIQDGFANGRVYLDSNLPEGEYLLAAYTPNSFFGDTTEFYAIRRIKVVISVTTWKETLVIPVPDKVNSIQFTTFPEGGNLVSGIASRVAYKAVNIKGEPVDIKGTLFEDNSPLLEFKSIHAGMGSFEFIPDTSKKYFIRLSEPAIDSTFLFPKIYPYGITIQLIGRDNESLSFKVSQNGRVKPEDIYIMVQCRGVVYGMTMAKLSKELRIKLPQVGFPQGIAEVTLFNSSLIPMAERLVYINYDRKLNIASELSNEIYAIRGKAILKIKVKDENGKPVVANLGVSVFDNLYQNKVDSNNILAHFYLSSQLKGRINNPSYYFNSKSKYRDEAMDLLMLTQGWRQYVWNEENLRKFREPLQQIIYDGITGKLSTLIKRKKIPMEQAFVIVSSPNIDDRTVLVLTDSAGAFIIPADYLKLWKDDYVYLKPPFSSKFKPDIKLVDPFKTIFHTMKIKEFIYPTSGLRCIKEEIQTTPIIRSKVIMIKEVTIKGNKTNTIHGKYLGKLDSLAKMTSDYVCRYNILNCKNHPHEQDNTKPIVGRFYLVQSPTGAFHSEVYHYSINSFQSYTEEELLKIYNLSRVKAYYGNREFYKPNYDKDSIDPQIPDFRNTLLWEPSVITDENGEATLSFYCSDLNTDFVGRIEGVSGEGLLGTGNFKFTVRKLKPTP